MLNCFQKIWSSLYLSAGKMSFAAIFISSSDFRCFIVSYICYLPNPVSMVERGHLNTCITPWIDNLLDIELGGAAEVEGSIIKFNEFMNLKTKTLEWHNVLNEYEKMRRATTVLCFFLIKQNVCFTFVCKRVRSKSNLQTGYC